MAGGRLRPSLPSIQNVPENLSPELRVWLRDLKLQLERFFVEARVFIPDFRVFGRVNRVALADLFILEPVEIFLEIFSDTGGAIASHATTAIRDGKLGQILIIQNINAPSITVRNNAKTKLSGGADVALGQYDTLAIRWDDANSQWVQWAGTNN